MILLMGVFIFPVSAFVANSSSVVTSYTDTTFLPPTYIPYEYEIALVAFGCFMLVLMRYFSELEVLFGLCAIIVFGAAAWLAAYVAKIDVFTMLDPVTNETTILYTQLVTPQPMMQVILVVAFLFSVIAEIYVMFLRNADRETDKGLSGTRPK